MTPPEPLLEDAPSTPGEQDTTLQSIVDLTAQVDQSGHLTWRPPSPGAWEVLRIGYTDSDARVSTSSGTWQGLAIDYLDRAAFDTYWTHTVAPLLTASRPYLKTTLINLATDSWELGGTNWTARFAEEFRKRRGYDPIRYLPIVAGRIVSDRATSDRFLNDLRRTVGDLVTDHYDHFAERAKQYGLGIQSESGGPHGAPIDALETFRSSAVPQTEYWAESKEHRTADNERFFTKEAASAADIYGKKFVANEGMTTIGPQWSESLATDLKPSFDQALTEGMNRLVWHQFTSSPKSFGLPGNEYFAGTHLNPNVTWWNQAEPFFRYLNRSQFLLQQGHAVDDVLYFYGDEVPNFVRLKRDDPAHVLPGYDYDVTNEDALLHTLTIRSGRISSPAGNAYRLLVLPIGRRLSLAALERIATYVHQGGSIAGQPPTAPTGITDAAATQRFSDLTHDLWNNCTQPSHPYGTGTVFCTSDTRAALKQLKVTPDYESDSTKLDYIHPIAGAPDIYYVRNPHLTPCRHPRPLPHNQPHPRTLEPNRRHRLPANLLPDTKRNNSPPSAPRPLRIDLRSLRSTRDPAHIPRLQRHHRNPDHIHRPTRDPMDHHLPTRPRSPHRPTPTTRFPIMVRIHRPRHPLFLRHRNLPHRPQHQAHRARTHLPNPHRSPRNMHRPNQWPQRRYNLGDAFPA